MKIDQAGKREIGFIAQELKRYFPELVYEMVEEKTGKTINSVNYNGIAVIAVKAIQEQQEIIEAQAETIEKQSERIDRLERKFEAMQMGQRRIRRE